MLIIPPKIDDEVKSISEILGGTIKESILKDELLKYVNRYRMDVDSAKKAVLKDHGYHSETIGKTREQVNKKINEITENDLDFDLIASVIDYSDKVVMTKNGTKKLTNLHVVDETGTLSITVWEIEKYPVVGSTYTFTNCNTNNYNGVLSVNLGNRGRFVENKNTVIKTNITDNIVSKALDINVLSFGMKDVAVKCVIETIYQDIVNTKNGPTEMYRGIASGTGRRIKFSSWSDHHLGEGEKVCLSKVSVKGFNDVLDMNIEDTCIVIRLD